MDRRHRPMFPTHMTRRLAWVALMMVLVAPSCGSDEDTSSVAPAGTVADSTTTVADSTTTDSDTTDSDDPSEWFPNVLAVESGQADDGSWTFSVTLGSPYDTPEQYADAWRVLGPDGAELGFRGLTHDHANEQPFTRSQNGIVIPDDVDNVTIQGRDLVNGWGGDTLDHELER